MEKVICQRCETEIPTPENVHESTCPVCRNALRDPVRREPRLPAFLFSAEELMFGSMLPGFLR